MPSPTVSVGSTPTLHYARGLDGVTEVRAGVYAFGDLVQAELGTCATDDIAIGVLASVIGHNRQHGRVLIDAGFLALSRSPRHRRFAGRLGLWCGVRRAVFRGELPEAVTPCSTNQEHLATVTSRSGEIDFDQFPIGLPGEGPAQPRLRDCGRL